MAADIDHTVAAALPISGLTAWQGLFDHGGLRAGQTVLVHGAAGGVGSLAVQLAREAGARVIGTGQAADMDRARAVFFVVEPDRDRLDDLAQRVRDGRLRVVVGNVRPMTEAATVFAPGRRTPGKTIIRVGGGPSADPGR